MFILNNVNESYKIIIFTIEYQGESRTLINEIKKTLSKFNTFNSDGNYMDGEEESPKCTLNSKT